MAYKLSVKAEEDILHILVEGMRLFGSEQAEHYHAGLEQAFEFLSTNPKAARERTEINPSVRVHPYDSHMIIYVIQPSGDVLSCACVMAAKIGLVIRFKGALPLTVTRNAVPEASRLRLCARRT